MPIVTIKVIDDTESASYDHSTVRDIADKLGKVFGSEPQGTWVQLEYLPPAQYAENEADTLDVHPTFVEILKGSLPSEDAMGAEALVVSEIVATILQRPQENCHVIYAPPGAGRIAFGGRRVRSDATP